MFFQIRLCYLPFSASLMRLPFTNTYMVRVQLGKSHYIGSGSCRATVGFTLCFELYFRDCNIIPRGAKRVACRTWYQIDLLRQSNLKMRFVAPGDCIHIKFDHEASCTACLRKLYLRSRQQAPWKPYEDGLLSTHVFFV